MACCCIARFTIHLPVSEREVLLHSDNTFWKPTHLVPSNNVRSYSLNDALHLSCADSTNSCSIDVVTRPEPLSIGINPLAFDAVPAIVVYYPNVTDCRSCRSSISTNGQVIVNVMKDGHLVDLCDSDMQAVVSGAQITFGQCFDTFHAILDLRSATLHDDVVIKIRAGDSQTPPIPGTIAGGFQVNANCCSNPWGTTIVEYQPSYSCSVCRCAAGSSAVFVYGGPTSNRGGYSKLCIN